jgi:hypothetical protein
MITFVATAFKESLEAYMFTSSLLLQRNPNWKAIIYCDAPNRYIQEIIENINDPRITYMENQTPKKSWGHFNRITALNNYVDTEFIIQTSVQDYYIPTAVGEIIKHKDSADLIYFNCLHNHFNYNILNSELKECRIDWGSFAVRTDIAKKVGITNPESAICDGLFITNLLRYPKLRIHYMNKVLTVHN